VRYIGSVGPEQRDRLLGGAVALLHLIRFDEPFGLSMVEAMACGTPVIAYARGSVPEIVRHGLTGLIVEDANAAVAAVADVHTLNRAQIRTTTAQRFSRERMVDDYLQLYKGIS
jgi:glycosyltransferase involved in cell wall biosynthesis